nr:BTAD domain-containing putative transcriptional regulator [Streptomyces sp. 846.5]
MVEAVAAGTRVEVGPPQRQAMLAVLALRAGHPVSVGELVDCLWGPDAPDSAVTTVRTYAWRLRKAFDAAGAGGVLASVGSGYRLAVKRSQVDALLVEELAAKASRAQALGELHEAEARLGEALDLWQGQPLAGVPGPYAERQRVRLDEIRVALLEDRLEVELDLGGHVRVVPRLSELIAGFPLRERPYGLLMRALYRSGRQVEALTVFAGLRRLLVSEQGIDPGPDLLSLHQRILESDPSLHAVRPAAATQPAAGAPGRTENPEQTDSETGAAARDAPLPEAGTDALPGSLAEAVSPAQLPPTIHDFTGREELVGQLCAALSGGGEAGGGAAPVVVAVVGMGGVGKTSLALHVAHAVRSSYPDGQIYADLRGVSADPADSGMVLAQFLVALGVARHAVPQSTEERTALLRSVLSGRRVLMVLDGARDAAQVRCLLPGTPGVGVLVTGRAQLFGLPLDLHVDLDVFEPEEALALLGRVIGADRLAAEQEAARRLIDACGHLPLAVRIVAARLASRRRWTIASLIDRLADERSRIGELRIGDLAIEAVFELGYRQLTPSHARVFRLLAALAGPNIGAATAAAVLDLDEDTAEDLLESLVDTAMLQSPVPGRYSFHDLLRVFARQKRPSESAGAVARWQGFLLASAVNAFSCAVPGDPVASVLAGVGAVAHSGLVFGSTAQARAWAVAECEGAAAAVELAVAQVPEAGVEPLRRAVTLLIALSPFGRDLQYGLLAAAARSAALAAEACGDDLAAGRARFLCGNVALQSGRLAEAELNARAAVERCRRADDVVVLRQALNDLGLVALYLRRFAEAAACWDEALELGRRVGHLAGERVTRLNAALARVRSGSPQEAVDACERVLAGIATDGGGDAAASSLALYVLGVALHEIGDPQGALERFSLCLDQCRAAGLRGREAQVLYRIADTLVVSGRPEEAVERAAQALDLLEGSPAERDLGCALLSSGRALHAAGDPERARERLLQARELFERLGLPEAEDCAAPLPPPVKRASVAR